MVSLAFSRFSTGSQVASWSGYPNHFIRYCGLFRRVLLSRIVSTSYSSWSASGITMAGGGVGLSKSVGNGWYGFNKDIWKTGWIFMVFGRSSLYAVVEITLMII